MFEVKNIHKVYHHPASELHVLKGINLQIREGEVVAVIGPSGAGKSTLLHIMGGLDRPTEGTIIFGGKDLYRMNDKERAMVRNEKVGFIFQFYHLLPEFTALENVMLPAMVKGNMRNMDAIKLRGVSLLERVGLKDRQSHKPYELSGGEQQRVAIARAMMNEPKVIFCDEPTGNLDSDSGQRIIDLLMELNAKNQQTLVVVTHDEVIAKRSQRIVRMRDGQLVDK